MPSLSVLFLNTHLVPIIDLPFGLSTRVHTLFLSNSSSSSCIAGIQSASSRASFTFFGSIWDRKQWYKHAFAVNLLVFTPLSGSPIIKYGGWLFLHLLASVSRLLESDAPSWPVAYWSVFPWAFSSLLLDHPLGIVLAVSLVSASTEHLVVVLVLPLGDIFPVGDLTLLSNSAGFFCCSPSTCVLLIGLTWISSVGKDIPSSSIASTEGVSSFSNLSKSYIHLHLQDQQLCYHQRRKNRLNKHSCS